MNEFLRDWYVSTFIKCTKCNGKLNLRHEGAVRIINKYPQIGGWFHVNCAVIRDSNCLELDKKLERIDA